VVLGAAEQRGAAPGLPRRDPQDPAGLGGPETLSWCWFDHLEADGPQVEGALASAEVREPDGRPAGRLAAWPPGRKPTRTATRMDARMVDPAGPLGWVSLVLIPQEVALLFDDPAVSQALRAVLSGPPPAAVSTLVRDAVHFAGAVTVGQGEHPDRLTDDPFARLHPARLLRLGPGLFGHLPPPPGPAIQRYAGKPWPAPGFDES
jgi:hypothetical protein